MTIELDTEDAEWIKQDGQLLAREGRRLKGPPTANCNPLPTVRYLSCVLCARRVYLGFGCSLAAL
jgi:hypothetical protein